MIKRLFAPLLGILMLLSLSCSSGPAKEDLADLVGNVFGFQSMTFMMLMYGMPIENAAMEMNEEQTEATITYTDYEVAKTLEAMGTSLEEAGDLPFATMNGTVRVADTGTMEFDLTLTEAVVTAISFSFDNATQEVTGLVADGKEYDISETLKKMAEKRMQEQQAADEAAEAELPQVQTTVE